MSLTAQQVSALSIGQSVVYANPDPVMGPLNQNGEVAFNDGVLLTIFLERGNALTFTLSCYPSGISALSLPA